MSSVLSHLSISDQNFPKRNGFSPYPAQIKIVPLDVFIGRWKSMLRSKNPNLRIKLIGSRSRDARQYNLSTTSEVATLIVGDASSGGDNRDIVIDKIDDGLQRISESHPSFMALQYPILFPYVEDDFMQGIPYTMVRQITPVSLNSGRRPRGRPIRTPRVEQRSRISSTATTYLMPHPTGDTSSVERARGPRNTVSLRQYYAYRLNQRKNEGQTLVRSGRLFQQYIVDAYTCIEADRADINLPLELSFTKGYKTLYEQGTPMHLLPKNALF